jgi:hypothetical protein
MPNAMMNTRKLVSSATVPGPDGRMLTVGDLPPANTRRWVARRKAEVVAAVRGGLISLDEACRRYTLSVEEFLSWQRAIDHHGQSGLRITRLQRYRTSATNPG